LPKAVWAVVPASPPLRLTIRGCLDDRCRECGSRNVYVLPNGDVLVAETNAPPK
jgi:hypothetical protein